MNLSQKERKYTLWEAMEIVLSEKADKTMHVKDIAHEVTIRGLYYQLDGNPVKPNQIGVRAWHRPHCFRRLKGNRVQLIDNADNE